MAGESKAKNSKAKRDQRQQQEDESVLLENDVAEKKTAKEKLAAGVATVGATARLDILTGHKVAERSVAQQIFPSGVGPTLLDHIKGKRAQYGETNTFTERIVVVSRLGQALLDSGNLEQLGQSYEAAFEELHRAKRWAQPTGLLLIFPTTCIHCVEVPPDSIGTVLDLMESHHAMGWLKKGSKMMMASYVPSPAYTAYNFKVMDTSTTTQSGEYQTSDSFETVAGSCLSNIIRLGEQKAFADGFPDSHSGHHALLPTGNLVEFLLKGNGLEMFATHHRRQTQTLDLTMGGELVWPMAERMYPYD